MGSRRRGSARGRDLGSALRRSVGQRRLSGWVDRLLRHLVEHQSDTVDLPTMGSITVLVASKREAEQEGATMADHTYHHNHHAAGGAAAGSALNRLAFSTTVHCLTG